MHPPPATAASAGGNYVAAPAPDPGYAPYPTISPEDVAPPPPPPPYHAAASYSAPPPSSGNPYVSGPAAGSVPPPKNTMDSVKDVLGKMGKRFGEAARKTENITGNFWQHLKTGPSIADAAMGRVSQITKVIAEGGYEKIFHQTFEVLPEEKLKKPFACYLSTSAGPVMGVLYLSNVKLAFCSDNPLAYKVGDKNEWSYYKVVIPLANLRSVNPSTSRTNAAEKYIQVVSVDNHEFWFMGFVYYDSAVKNLQEALQEARILQA